MNCQATITTLSKFHIIEIDSCFATDTTGTRVSNLKKRKSWLTTDTERAIIREDVWGPEKVRRHLGEPSKRSYPTSPSIFEICGDPRHW